MCQKKYKKTQKKREALSEPRLTLYGKTLVIQKNPASVETDAGLFSRQLIDIRLISRCENHIKFWFTGAAKVHSVGSGLPGPE